ncbi:hypothetical protein B0T16DRAFT_390710 [Cercophora newfieldiana]|uniref:Secreted protein n=1 Tax=Cercophora newfieldiana TaxID=92897 RepID=A0AA39Y6G3_9PEZI|nr:hypothetical protein B0T16DRAFT_390710 [Cercophora newfieldiana]
MSRGLSLHPALVALALLGPAGNAIPTVVQATGASAELRNRRPRENATEHQALCAEIGQHCPFPPQLHSSSDHSSRAAASRHSRGESLLMSTAPLMRVAGDARITPTRKWQHSLPERSAHAFPSLCPHRLPIIGFMPLVHHTFPSPTPKSTPSRVVIGRLTRSMDDLQSQNVRASSVASQPLARLSVSCELDAFGLRRGRRGTLWLLFACWPRLPVSWRSPVNDDVRVTSRRAAVM